jgi:hypothetical protein
MNIKKVLVGIVAFVLIVLFGLFLIIFYLFGGFNGVYSLIADFGLTKNYSYSVSESNSISFDYPFDFDVYHPGKSINMSVSPKKSASDFSCLGNYQALIEIDVVYSRENSFYLTPDEYRKNKNIETEPEKVIKGDNIFYRFNEHKTGSKYISFSKEAMLVVNYSPYSCAWKDKGDSYAGDLMRVLSTIVFK